MGVTFETVVVRVGAAATALAVPAETLFRLTPQRRPRVSVAVAGHRYETTVTVIEGRSLLPLRGIDRAAAALAVGDHVQVTIDQAPGPPPRATYRSPIGQAPHHPTPNPGPDPGPVEPTPCDEIRPVEALTAASAVAGSETAASETAGAGAPERWLLTITTARLGPQPTLVVTMTGEIDAITLGRFRDTLTRVLLDGRSTTTRPAVVLDLRAVGFLSRAGLAALIDTARAGRRFHDGPVRVVIDTTRPVLRLGDADGHRDVLTVHHRLETALDVR